MQGKKFISPGAWFSMNYPSDWNEFEDGEGSFLFYNPDVWTGNFRISAFKGKAGYGKDAIRQELKENDSASLVKVGTWECAYSKEMFQEEGAPANFASMTTRIDCDRFFYPECFASRPTHEP